MAEEKSVLGPILIGCGLFGLLCLLVCGGGLALFIPRAMQQMDDVMQQVSQEMSKQQLLEAFPEGWRAPAPEAADEELFPQTIGNFSRLVQDTAAAPAELGLADHDGRHATYEAALSKVEIYAYRVDDAEKIEMTQALEESLGANFSTHLTSTVSQSNYESTYFSATSPHMAGWLWSSEGWMFLIVSDDQLTASMLLTEYLKAIQPPAPEEPESLDPVDHDEPTDESSDAADPEGLPNSPANEESDFPPPPPQPESVQ